MLNPLIFAFAASTAVATTESAPAPIACRPHALDTAQRKRQQALLDVVRRRVTGTHELTDGLALSFPADAAVFLQVAEWISLERRCCPFLAFALEWKEDDTVSVRLTGQPGVKEAIAAEMGISLAR